MMIFCRADNGRKSAYVLRIPKALCEERKKPDEPCSSGLCESVCCWNQSFMNGDFLNGTVDGFDHEIEFLF